MKNAPCKECTERQQGCHGRCDKYKNWVNEHQKEKAFIDSTKQSEEDFHRARWRWNFGVQ